MYRLGVASLHFILHVYYGNWCLILLKMSSYAGMTTSLSIISVIVSARLN